MIPDRFFKMNFWLIGLLILQLGNWSCLSYLASNSLCALDKVVVVLKPSSPRV